MLLWRMWWHVRRIFHKIQKMGYQGSACAARICPSYLIQEFILGYTRKIPLVPNTMLLSLQPSIFSNLMIFAQYSLSFSSCIREPPSLILLVIYKRFEIIIFDAFKLRSWINNYSEFTNFLIPPKQSQHSYFKKNTRLAHFTCKKMC